MVYYTEKRFVGYLRGLLPDNLVIFIECPFECATCDLTKCLTCPTTEARLVEDPDTCLCID